MLLTKRMYLLIGGALLASAAVALASTAVRDRAVPVTIADETAIHVTLNQALTSNQSRPGDHFEATVSEPIVVDGKTVVPAGALATGLVVDSQRSGHLMGRGRLELALEAVDVNGVSYDIHTLDSNRIGRSHKKRNIELIGGGAGAGVATAFITGKKNVRLPAETRLTFRLSEPVTITTKT
jgi:hypothetical protein